LHVDHPGVIWSGTPFFVAIRHLLSNFFFNTVIAFDAHVLQWSLDDNPPARFARHHIKEASFYGVDTWTVDILIRLPENDPSSGVAVNFVGVKESVQWPAKRKAKQLGEIKGNDFDDLRLLEEIHDWLEKRNGDSIDALLFGTVGGIVTI